MIHCKKFLVLFCLLTSTGLVHAQEGNFQNVELTALLRQLEQMQGIVAKADHQPIETHSRYYFDYKRLNGDLKKIRAGIEYYINPKRAQPRDMSELIGDYQQETDVNRGKK